jgi:hypothetical protein
MERYKIRVCSIFTERINLSCGETRNQMYTVGSIVNRNKKLGNVRRE